MNEKPFEEIDHTADTGLHVRGTSLEELLTNAALGMFSLLLLEDIGALPAHFQKEPESRHPVHLKAASMELLLKDWLAELLFLHTTERIFFTDFRINTLLDISLDANACGHKISEEDERFFTEIKAVTYHGLKITETDEGYQARVIFDI